MSLKEFLAHRSHGGVHAPHRKNTAECETVELPIPETVTIAMAQHLGAPCVPTVKVGDEVTVGQVVGDSEQPFSAPVHSSVSGKVTALTEVLLQNGRKTAALVITTDKEQRVSPEVKAPTVTNFDEFLKAVRACGLVGLGGAGFPTHIKLNPKNLDEIQTLIINAAECEPYITTDYRECMENSWDIVAGVQTVMEYLDVSNVIIAIEKNKPKAIEELTKIAATISKPKHVVTVQGLPARYPQGAEKVLIQVCTGRQVPPGGLPADVGCVVMNVTSIATLARFLKTGMPLVSKRVTVDGSAIEKPMNVRVPIGTSVKDILAFCGVKEPIGKLLLGGPMMGQAMMSDEMPILKQNNAIIAMNERDAAEEQTTACIRCGRCVDACPMKLVPTAIEHAYQAKDVEAMEKLSVMTCMECGSCSFSCPAHRPLVQTFRLCKDMVRNSRKSK